MIIISCKWENTVLPSDKVIKMYRDFADTS